MDNNALTPSNDYVEQHDRNDDCSNLHPDCATCPNDQSVWVWDAKMGEQPKELEGHSRNTNSVVFSPDNSKLVSDSGDQLAHGWTNLGLDASWMMDRDGWILSAEKRLIWVPPTIHNVLCHPYTILIISRHGSARISFGNSKLGPLWHQCYTQVPITCSVSEH